MRWLTETGLIGIDPKAREEHSDRKRIEATLKRLGNGTAERRILDGYFDKLKINLERGETSIRSIRLALTPAAALCQAGLKMGIVPPDQNVLGRYLAKTPGQRAALSGFVGYLKEMYEIEINLPRPTSRAGRSGQLTREQELLKLLKDSDNELNQQSLLEVALRYFHGMPKKTAKRASLVDISKVEDDGVELVLEGKSYWLPVDIIRRKRR
ncbi:MAG TPA: hypothetical protein VIT91_11810 [Chthoniobacterales bacterium]